MTNNLASENIQLPSGYQAINFYGGDNQGLLEKICKLRFSVWREQKVKMIGDFSSSSWADAEESNSTHWAVFYSGELIATSRMTVYNSVLELPDASFYAQLPGLSTTSISYLTRDVVASSHQNRGIGRYLNQVRIRESKTLGVKTVLASIPEYRIPSFEKLGFQLIRTPRFGSVFPEIKWAVVAMKLA